MPFLHVRGCWWDTARVKENVVDIGHNDLIIGHLLVFTTSSLKRKMVFVVAVSVNQDPASNLFIEVSPVCQIWGSYIRCAFRSQLRHLRKSPNLHIRSKSSLGN